MNASVESAPVAAPVTEAWRILELDATDSTNAVARTLDPWQAVVARIQTSGRGRHARRWHSEEGGLWLSAVVPTPPPLTRWQLLPLAAGGALCRALQDLGVPAPRLRWPNDVMIGPAKLAGILVERFTSATAVVGLGVNVTNRPEAADAALAGLTVRLADLLDPAPSLPALRAAILAHLRGTWALVAAGRVAELSGRLRPFWTAGRVRLVLRASGLVREGGFLGIDNAGRLGLDTGTNAPLWFDPVDVELLRELF